MIPFLDLQAAYEELSDPIDAAVQDVLRSGWYIGGPAVESFETAFAGYCGAQHCVGVANGLDALILALEACDIGPGDGVIVPSNTFIATWLAVSAVGAIPQPVEPDPNTYNIDPARIADSITAITKAIIPVDLYGQPADMPQIAKVAKQHNLVIIEDAAQGHGATLNGEVIGKYADAVCWSFYPGKNLGALGDAGAVTTNNADIAKRVRMNGNYGSQAKYVNEAKGRNSRLDPVQAAVLNVKLQHLDSWTGRRRRIAGMYHEQVDKTSFVPPTLLNNCDPSWHLYVIRCADREFVQKEMAVRNVQTLIHYPIPPHLQKAYQDMDFYSVDLTLAENLANEVLSLPIGPHVSDTDVSHIMQALTEVDSLQ